MDPLWMPWKLAATVRFAVAAAIATYALAYEPPPGVVVPGYVTPIALAIAADLLVLAILQVRATGTPDRGMRSLYLCADLASPVALLYLYSFDPRQVLFVLLFVAMAQGALALRLTGAVVAWGISAGAYIALQVQAEEVHGTTSATPTVVALRIFIMLIIAVLIAKLTENFERGATAREAAERSLRYQASLLENVSDAVLATDLQMVITYWNPAAESIYGWPADEVIGQPLHDVLPSIPLGKAPDLSARALDDPRSVGGEFLQYRRDGTPVFVEAKGLALRDDDGSVTGYVTVNRQVVGRAKAPGPESGMRPVRSPGLVGSPAA